MKKHLYTIISILAFAFVLSGCDKDIRAPYYHDYVTYGVLDFVNESYSSVTFFVPAKGEGLPPVLDEWYMTSFYEVNSHSMLPLDCMYDYVKSPIETYGKGEAVPFYVFDTQTLKDNEWKDVVEGEMWLAVYTYTATRIIELGKKVTYPEVKTAE